MTELQSIGGSVDNGRTGVALFPFRVGPIDVGVRERDGAMEIAFYSPPLNLKLPVEGLVDGQRVRVVSIRARDPDPDVRLPTSSKTPRAIVAIVVPV